MKNFGTVLVDLDGYDENVAKITFKIPEDKVEDFKANKIVYNGLLNELRGFCLEYETDKFASKALYEKDSVEEGFYKDAILDIMLGGADEVDDNDFEDLKASIDECDFTYERLLDEMELDSEDDGEFVFKGEGIEDLVWNPDIMLY